MVQETQEQAEEPTTQQQEQEPAVPVTPGEDAEEQRRARHTTMAEPQWLQPNHGPRFAL